MSEDEEDVISKQKTKRRRIIADLDSDEENENKTTNVPEKKVEKVKNISAVASPIVKKKTKAGSTFEEKLGSLTHNEGEEIEESEETILEDIPVIWTHNKLEFLKPENVKDIKGRKKDNPEYDPTSLYVPKSYLDSLTPVKWANFSVVAFLISLYLICRE